jgi:hypothetical protein
MDKTNQKNIKKLFEKPLYGSVDTFINGGLMVITSKLFYSYFGQIPNIYCVDKIDDKKLRSDVIASVFGRIIYQITREEFDALTQLDTLNIHNFFLESGILINVSNESTMLYFTEQNRDEAFGIFEELKKYKIKRKKTTEISLITMTNSGLETQEIAIKKPKIDFCMHYNEDFFTIHKAIVKNINKLNTNGLYLFHGHPGTGKTTYIKYLIHQIHKKVIFLSTKMAGELDNVAMTPFLLQNRNAVIVIEDAEELITSRDEVRNSNLSMLLNLTDGLLGESLGIQIVATFNTDVKNIDKALLRKGRLSNIYEFKPLALVRTNALLNKLNYQIKVTQPLAVADIFNFEISNNYEPKLKKAVGFRN